MATIQVGGRQIELRRPPAVQAGRILAAMSTLRLEGGREDMLSLYDLLVELARLCVPPELDLDQLHPTELFELLQAVQQALIEPPKGP